MAAQVCLYNQFKTENDQKYLFLTNKKRIEKACLAVRNGNIELYKTLLEVQKLVFPDPWSSLLKNRCITEAAKYGQSNVVFFILNESKDEIEAQSLRGLAYIFALQKHLLLARNIKKSGYIKEEILRTAHRIKFNQR